MAVGGEQSGLWKEGEIRAKKDFQKKILGEIKISSNFV
jgi:hypothetical protein